MHKELRKNDASMKQHWSHHPLLVSGLSILIGSFGLYAIQVRTDRSKALMSKRLDLITKVVEYRESAAGLFRYLDQFTCQIEKGHLSKQGQVRKEEDFNDRMNSFYNDEELLQTNLEIYFQDNDVMSRFSELKDSIHGGINTFTSDLEVAAPTGVCHADQRQAQLVNKLNEDGRLSQALLIRLASMTRI